MQDPIEQCIGIDIAKESFTACVCQRDLSGDRRLSPVVELKNNRTGFNQLVKWFRKLSTSKVPVTLVMEATGNHYENLAYHFYNLNMRLSVVLPNKVLHYAKSLNVKTKTDAVDARVIAQLGVERKLSSWKPPRPIFKQLKELTRQYSELKKEKTVFLNRIDAIRSGYDPHSFTIKSNKAVIKTLQKQIQICEEEIETLIKSDEWLWAKVKNVLTIKGVGFITVAIVLAETQGFEFVQNIRQLASYAGLDVVRRESGTSVLGKTRISKKGNGRIRSALYFPAISAGRYNEDMKQKYHRITNGKPSKMVGITALQRRVLILMYTLWRKDEGYIENYHQMEKTEAGRSKNNLPAQDELQPRQPKLSLV
jgi:transposase